MSIWELVRGGNLVLSKVLICLKNADYLVRVFLSLSWLVWALPYFSCARWEQIVSSVREELCAGPDITDLHRQLKLPTSGNCSNSWPRQEPPVAIVGHHSIVLLKYFLGFTWSLGITAERVFCALLIHWTKYWWFTSTNKKYFVSVRTIETMSIIALRLLMIASWTSEIHHLGNHLAVVVQDDCLVLYERCLCW